MGDVIRVKIKFVLNNNKDKNQKLKVCMVQNFGTEEYQICGKFQLIPFEEYTDF